MGKSLATGNQREWELLYSQGSAIYQLTCSSGGTSNVTLSYAGVVPATDTWFDFFFGYDRASSRMWMSIDAGPLQFATLNGGIFVGTANFCIGAQAGGTASRFAGSVDTAGYWNRTLRMHEIRRMHQARLYSFR